MSIYCFETKQFRLTVNAVPCTDLDLSWDDDGSVARELESGALVAFDVEATCVHKDTGLAGHDYLGQCIYRDESEFRDNVGIRQRRYGSYFSDMVHRCIADLRATVAKAGRIKLRGGAGMNTDRIYRVALVYAQSLGLDATVDNMEAIITAMRADLALLAVEYNVEPEVQA